MVMNCYDIEIRLPGRRDSGLLCKRDEIICKRNYSRSIHWFVDDWPVNGVDLIVLANKHAAKKQCF